VGYGEIVAYLDGQWDLAHARELIERHTWRLAKRQLTWFRHVTGIHWITLTGTPDCAAIQLIQDVLAKTLEPLPEPSPTRWQEEQGTSCTCPTSR